MAYLYRLDFANGKSYIGATKQSMERRIGVHRSNAKRRTGFKVYSAWLEFGEPKISVLAVIENSELHETEVRAIKIYNTFTPNGYNMTIGGKTSAPGRFPSKETRLKMSLAAQKRKSSPETKAKIAATLTGIKRSDSMKEKMRQIGLKRSRASIEKMLKGQKQNA